MALGFYQGPLLTRFIMLYYEERSMKKILLLISILIIVLLVTGCTKPTGQTNPFTSANPVSSPVQQVLAKVGVSGNLADIGLPIYAHIMDGRGQEYVLAKTTPAELDKSGLKYTILDPDTRDISYAIALKHNADCKVPVDYCSAIILDDGKHLILRAPDGQKKLIASADLDFNWLPDTPLILIPRSSLKLGARTGSSVTYDSHIGEMVSAVRQDTLSSLVGGLSGEQPLTVDGEKVTITSRATESGESIKKATRYFGNYLAARNLTVEYPQWTSDDYSGTNVIGTKTGKTKPREIVLVTAHIDTEPAAGRSPGADDDASGVAAVMLIADLTSRQDFDRTIRFATFSGEEQGLLGSDAYARQAAKNDETIVAVYNMDMISWNKNSNVAEIHTRIPSNPGYEGDMEIANVFTNVVSKYDLSGDITPVVLSDGEELSDQASFWEQGYPGIWALEDGNNDFNPHYHSPDDLHEKMNMKYYTAYVKASTATVAHLAGISG